MKSKSNVSTANLGFTRVELVVLIVAVTLVAAIAFVGFSALGAAKRHAVGLNCLSQLKQVTMSFRLWAGDNDNRFPMQVSTNAGGTKELVASGSLAPHFLVMSNELESPTLLKCPGDKATRVATTWEGLTDATLSYFVVLEADESLPQLWLSGDSNLTTNSIPLKSGVVTVSKTSQLGATTKRHGRVSNLVFADGSAQQVPGQKLVDYATNALRYYQATTNATLRIAIP